MVTVFYFAGLRETLGRSREEVAVPGATATVLAIVEQLRARDGRWNDAFAPGKSWRIAVNQCMADLATPVKPGDEVAFFPPVTGG